MIFDEIIGTIENYDMTEFAQVLIDTIPDYFWSVPASSSGKYHPEYALGYGGLARHTCALVRFLNHIFDIECIANDFTSRERDVIRIAGMMHDTRKSGTQEEWEADKATKHEHPLFAAKVVRDFDDKYLNHDEIELIADCISSHMGMWVTSDRSDVILPKPITKYQKLLHMADYLASRKDIEVKFEFTVGVEPDTPKTWKIPFGKHKGMTLEDIKMCDPSYLVWLRDKADMEIREPLKTFLENM